MKTLAIIGGGAAGLAAAVAAARAVRASQVCAQAKRPAAGGLRIVLFEADERVGRSILATGNGRCNFSNAEISAGVYRNADFVAEALLSVEQHAAERDFLALGEEAASAALHANAIQSFFAGLGLEWREEAEGRLYPLANKASSVLDVLRGAARVLGVEERCGCAVAQVEPPASYGGKGKRFTLHVADGSFERADAVIVACGGRTARMMLPDGFAYAEPQPVLGPLATEAHLTRQLDNIRVRGVARLLRDGEEVARESGEVLFRKYGLSGIAVFNLSRFARAGDVIELDVLPSVAQRDAESYAFRRYETLALLHGGGLTCGDYLRGLVLPQVARTVLKEIGFDEDAVLTCRQATAIIGAFKNLRFAVGGVADERQCQVHRGGFSVQEFDARTMQARTLPGLFLAGEALDVDAPCGGYNLHWAWASGMLAGWNAAGCLLGPSTSTPGEEPAKKESGEAGVSC